MKLGKRSTTIHVPPWSFTADYPSPRDNGAIDDNSLLFLNDSLKALQRYLPSNDAVSEFNFPDGSDAVDAHTCDHFRMFEFKVRMCSRGRSHDWTECPFAHPGEKARRRDPRKFHYSGTACPDFRKGYCRKGDSCEFAHGVFECWLHPARYRTQPCKDGMSCTRRVCFFAHAPEQLRVLSPRALMSSPETVSPATDSPPVSPMSGNLVDETASFLRRLQLNKVMSMPNSSSWMSGPGGSLSPRVNMNRTGFLSLPSTPTQEVTRHELGYFDVWDNNQEDPVIDRVESGRNLRAKMFEKLSRENPLDRVDPDPDPDLGWVSDLVK